MARRPKASNAKTTGATDSNFGNAEAVPANPKYIANFDGDEIDGKTYSVGDEIDSKVDAATIRYLVQIGRITEKSAGDSDAPAGGTTEATNPAGTPTPAEGGEGGEGEGEGSDAETFIDRNVEDISDDEIAALSDEQKAEIVKAEQDREQPRVTLLRRLGVEVDEA